MLRLVCTSPYFWFCAVPPTTATTQSKYVIKKLAYLIEAPPKRPVSGWALYLKTQFAGKSNLKVSTDTPALAKKWKTFPEIQEKYNKLAEQQNKGYQKIKDDYENMFVTPFKRISGHNLRLKKLFTDKKIEFAKGTGIQKIGEQVKKAFQEKRTLKEEQDLKAEAKKISEQREAQRKKYQFPKLQHTSLQSYKLRHSLPEDQRGPDYEKMINDGYQAHVNAWKAQVDKWLKENKYGITFEQFQKLYKKALKEKKAKRNDEDD